MVLTVSVHAKCTTLAFQRTTINGIMRIGILVTIMLLVNIYYFKLLVFCPVSPLFFRYTVEIRICIISTMFFTWNNVWRGKGLCTYSGYNKRTGENSLFYTLTNFEYYAKIQGISVKVTVASGISTSDGLYFSPISLGYEGRSKRRYWLGPLTWIYSILLWVDRGIHSQHSC